MTTQSGFTQRIKSAAARSLRFYSHFSVLIKETPAAETLFGLLTQTLSPSLVALKYESTTPEEIFLKSGIAGRVESNCSSQLRPAAAELSSVFSV